VLRESTQPKENIHIIFFGGAVGFCLFLRKTNSYMKKQLTLLLAAAFAGSLSSQVVLSEDFNSPFQLSVGGWTIQNNSNPTNGSWFQGDGTNYFPAFNGGPNDYVGVNYNSTGANGDISNWLISPTLSIHNGAVVQFATRTEGPTVSFPDRLQLRMSPTAAYSIPSGTASVGTFSVLMLDINPNLTTNTSSVVSNGTVNGYPVTWAVYSIPVTGVTGTVTGRFAFRYVVEDSGANGNNGNYIGIDAFRYVLTCAATVPSYTVCAGTSVTLSASGAASGATYTWNTNANTSSIVVNPSSTTVYTLTTTESAGVCPAVTSTVTIGTNLSVNVSASSNTVCAGKSATLSAMSAAASYSWMNNSATTATTVVTPTATTIYTVLAWSGFPPTCVGGNTIAISVDPGPTVTITGPTGTLCTTGSTTINYSASGASAYAWVTGTTGVISPTIGFNVPAAASTIFTLQLIGVVNGCTASAVTSLSIDIQPTVSIAASANTVCTKGTATFTASGASSYQWSGASTASGSPVTFTAPATTGTATLNVVGTTSLGCGASASKTISVLACGGGTTVGVDENGVFVNTSVFPNPFSNELRITSLEGTVMVYNALGQIVLNQRVEGSAVINTADFAKGAYIVKTINLDGETVKTVRMMKN
jgi:hypothetical protein